MQIEFYNKQAFMFKQLKFILFAFSLLSLLGPVQAQKATQQPKRVEKITRKGS